MRKAINDNPVVQIGLLGVLGVLVAVVFMGNMGGGGAEPEATTDAAATPTETAAPSTASTAAPPATAPSTAAPDAAATAVPAGSTPFEASKGLPADFVESYEAGETPVLLVLDEKGWEDKALVRELVVAKYPEGTAIFFAETGDGSKYTLEEEKKFLIPAANQDKFESLPIAKYSRIAEGVSLDRTPAIIVLHPLKTPLEKGETAPMPEASVSYGYRGKESITQAVNDALYKGDSKTYAP